MTIPVARTHVRRNVRMAVALVVGQVVLCVVIGYIALGGLGSHPKVTPRAVGPLAAPTEEAVPPPSTTSRPSSKPGQPALRDTPPGPPVVPNTIAAPPADAPQLLQAPPGDLPAATTTSAQLATTAPTTGIGTSSPTPNNDQGVAPQNSRAQPDAELGDPCDKAHQSGVTSDGVDVVCLPDSQGDLVWQRPKQPPGQNK